MRVRRLGNRLASLAVALLLAVVAIFASEVAAFAGGPVNGWTWQTSQSSSGYFLRVCGEPSTTCSASSFLTSTAFTAQVTMPNPLPSPPSGKSTWWVIGAYCNGVWVDGASGGISTSPPSNYTYTATASGWGSCDWSATSTLKVGYFYAWSQPTGAQVRTCDSVDQNGVHSTTCATWKAALQFSRGSLATASTCSYSAAGSYDGTRLAVRLAGVTSPPAGGWQVDVPDPGSLGDGAMTVRTIDTVDGSPNTYYRSVAYSTTATTARVTALDATGSPVCYVSLTLSGNAINPSAGSTTLSGGDDGSDGTSCSLTWNLLALVKCSLRWAFVPSSGSLDSLQSAFGDLSETVPFNYLSAAHALFDDLQVGGSGCGAPVDCIPTVAIAGTTVLSSDTPAWVTYVSDYRGIVGNIFDFIILGGLAVMLFWRLAPIVGGGRA